MTKRAILAALVSACAPSLIRLHLATLRIRWLGVEPCDPPVDLRTPFIYAFWHQRLLLFAFTHRNQGVTVLISQHADGELIARAVEGLGFHTVRGSTTRGGGKALFQLAQRRGVDLAVTPDGPRGPRHRLQAGVVYLAARTGYPVIPATVSYQRFWQFRSWDRFILPRPFTRALVRAAPPFTVPPEGSDDPEPYRRRLEEALREVTEDTDRRFAELWPVARPTGPQFLRTRTMPSK
jgi:lysophospholipid acyltransferase (LPLAT)-like uncharacterized protein